MRKNLSKMMEAMAGIASVDERLQQKIAEPGVSSAPLEPAPTAEDSRPKTGMGVATHAAKLQAKIDNLEARLKAATESNAAVFLDVSVIEANPWQPRKFFDDSDLELLKGSIRAYGVLSPVAVRAHPQTPGAYQLIAGERRTRASRQLGLATIPAVVLEMTDAEMGAQALAENIVRADLTDYEIGLALAGLKDNFPDRLEMAETFGVSRTQLYRYLSFGDLPVYIRTWLDKHPAALPAYVALELSRLLKNAVEAPPQQKVEQVLAMVVDGKMEVRDLVSVLSQPVAQAGASSPRTPVSDRTKTVVVFKGKRVGLLSKDAESLQLKLKRSSLSADQEQQIQDFIATLFK